MPRTLPYSAFINVLAGLLVAVRSSAPSKITVTGTHIQWSRTFVTSLHILEMNNKSTRCDHNHHDRTPVLVIATTVTIVITTGRVRTTYLGSICKSGASKGWSDR